jgi:lipopolysaccharide transport system permease protein
LNPLTGVIEGFRWAPTGQGRPPDLELLASASMVFVILFGGLLYFNKMESTIADVV